MASNPLAGLMQAAPQGPDESDAAGGQISPAEAQYKPPQADPFMCGTCEYFMDPNSCQKVGGVINPEGICKLYESGGAEAMAGGGMPPMMGGAPKGAPVGGPPKGGGGGLPPGLK